MVFSTNTSVNSMVENIERILEVTHSTVESMAVGERIQLKELVEKVASAVSMDPKTILGFVSYFAHSTDIAYVTRGKNGGVVRGIRPAKTVKAGKKTQTVETTTPTE